MRSRRIFLRQLGWAACVASLTPWAGAATAARPGRRALAGLGWEAFASELGSGFVVRDEARTVGLVLAEATAQGAGPAGRSAPTLGAEEVFTLMFKGPQTSPLAQNTYRFEHERLGGFDLFIVPVEGGTSAGARYAAVFHRLAASALEGAPRAVPART